MPGCAVHDTASLATSAFREAATSIITPSGRMRATIGDAGDAMLTTTSTFRCTTFAHSAMHPSLPFSHRIVP